MQIYIEDAVCSLANAVAELENTSARLRARRRNRSNLRLPAVALPPEILGEIFLYTCFDSSAPLSTGKLPRDFRKTRHNIASTCSVWHDVALIMSTLWSHILIATPFPHTNPEAVTPELPLLLLELERSANRPLNLTIRCSVISEQWPPIMATLPAVLSRCESIKITDLVGNGCDAIMKSANTIHFPHLRNFVVCIKSLERVPHVFDLSGAPNLQYLSIAGAVNLVDCSPHQLNQLSVNAHSTIRLDMRVLSSCRLLETLELIFGLKYSDGCESINLPALRRLSYGSSDMYSPPLSSIVAPNLHHLRFTPRLTSHLTNQFSSLRCLDLVSSIPIFSLSEELQNVPNLEKLRFSQGSSHFLEVADVLLQRDHSGAFQLAPRLHELSIRFSDMRMIEELLSARNGDAQEGPEMPFIICFGGATSSSAFRAAMAEFRQSHPWSIQPYVPDLSFDSDNWTEIHGE